MEVTVIDYFADVEKLKSDLVSDYLQLRFKIEIRVLGGKIRHLTAHITRGIALGILREVLDRED